ncbi:hypothetical protein B0H17DRAFT_935443 [Mycena rosella]|uniref:DUF7330 domain-containing protein n=1 Tax=Mycena rosella TaxID=1033263 RepID=A0AAD7DGU1_MYCRO|nr:hypothetical protein B0H17DRAFT_935443 [Mycena rosella]
MFHASTLKVNQNSPIAVPVCTNSALPSIQFDSSSPPQDDPPPPYFDSRPQASSSSRPARESPAGVRATNFVSLSRANASIVGTYAIDPRIKNPLVQAARRNLSLHTRNGVIDVNLFVTGEAESKVDMLLKSSNGAVNTRIHAAAVRPTLHIAAQASNGPMTIHLPPSFRGPVTIHSHIPLIRFSDRLAAEVTILSEVTHKCRCFVGDLPDYLDGAWAGDVLDVHAANGCVILRYADDSSGSPLVPWTAPPSTTGRAAAPTVVHNDTSSVVYYSGMSMTFSKGGYTVSRNFQRDEYQPWSDMQRPRVHHADSRFPEGK